MADRIDVILVRFSSELQRTDSNTDQERRCREGLERKGIPHAYIAFEGEGHGFRKQESVRRSLEATLSFIGQVFGFAAADELEPLELTSAR